MRRRFALTVIALLLASSSTVSAGDPPAEPIERGPTDQPEAVTPVAASAPDSASEARLRRARSEFSRGSVLRKQGLWTDALEAYRKSAGLHPHPVTSYNIALCLRALARYTQAQKMFVTALSERDQQGKVLPTNVAERTHGYLRAIAARLARVRVTMGRPNLALAIDGRPLETITRRDGSLAFVAGTRPAGEAEVPVRTKFDILIDPGDHVFVVTHGTQSRAVTRTFATRQTLSLYLDLVDPPPPPPRDVRPAAAAWIASGVALVAATVAGAIAIDRKQSLDDACPTAATCPEQSQSDIDTLLVAGNISTVGFAVAGAGAALGTVLYFTAPRRASAGKEVGGGFVLRF